MSLSATTAEKALPAATQARPAPVLRRGLVIYAAAALAFGIFHIFLGADGGVVALAVAAVLLSLAPAWFFGWRDMPSLVALLAGMRYAMSALVWKAAEFSALDQGLYAPLDSFTVVFAGMAAVAAAAFASHLIGTGRPIVSERYSIAGLRSLVWVSAPLVLGVIYVRFARMEVLGGIQALMGAGIVLLSVSWCALNYRVRGKILSPGFIAYLALIIPFTFAFNSRLGTALTLLGMASFVLAFRVHIPRGLIIAAIAGVLFFLGYISPAITDVRNIQYTASSWQLIEATAEQVGKRLLGEEPEIYSFGGESKYSLHYIDSRNHIIARAVNVQQMDFVVALAASRGPIGTERFWRGMLELLPAVLITNKEAITQTNYALWIYGIYDWGFENSIEVTAFGSAFVFGGYEFLVACMFAMYGLLFVAFRLFCPNFDNSLMGAFFVATYLHAFTASTALGIAGILMREMPFEILIFWFASRIR